MMRLPRTRFALAAAAVVFFGAASLSDTSSALSCEIVVSTDGAFTTIVAHAADDVPGPVFFRVVAEIFHGSNVSVAQQSGAQHLLGDGRITQVARTVIRTSEETYARVSLVVEGGASTCHTESRIASFTET